jgi:hypothetical protein
MSLRGKGGPTKITTILNNFLGKGFPSTASRVRVMLAEMGLGFSAKDISMANAQRIADRLSMIPAAEAPEMLKKTMEGMRNVVKTKATVYQPKSAVRAILDFFDIKESRVQDVGTKLQKVRAKVPLAKGYGRLGAAGGLAYAINQLREGGREARELDIAGAMSPTADDMFRSKMIEDLELRTRMRSAGQSGLNPGAIESLLGPESPLSSMTIPASSGFPVG